MYLQGAVQVLGGHATCKSEYLEDGDVLNDCDKTTFKSHVAYYDLHTPDIFVFTKKA